MPRARRGSIRADTTGKGRWKRHTRVASRQRTQTCIRRRTTISATTRRALQCAGSAQVNASTPKRSSTRPVLARRPNPASNRAAAPPPARSLSVSDNLGSAAASRSTAPLVWSGGRGGVSDLGSGEQPIAEASAASTLGSPSARDAKCRPCGRRSRDARWTKSDSRTPSASPSSVCLASLPRSRRCASLTPIAPRWPVLRNRGGRPTARDSRPPRATIARGRAGAPRRMRAIAQARRASGQARP